MARLAGYDGSTFKAKTGSSSLLLHEGIRRLTILPNPLQLIEAKLIHRLRA